MALTQSHYRGRNDGEALNSSDFTHSVDANWMQQADRTFRVRFEVEGAGTLGGTLEAKSGAGEWFPVSNASGTVTAALSEQFTDGDLTTNVILGSSLGFATGSGSTAGAATAVTLAGEHTELEYAVQIISGDVSSGGTVSLRVADLDSYAKTPAIIAAFLSDRDGVRLKIGDNQADKLLTDTEVDSYIAAWPENLELAAADAADAIAAKYARGFTFATDGQSFNRRERYLHYTELAERLRKRGAFLVWPT